MSQTVPLNPVPPGTAVKKRRPRSAPKARPAFFVIQVLDEQGQPMPFDKKRIKVVLVERDAEVVMDVVDKGDNAHAFYIRGMMPPGRAPGVAQPPRNPTT